MNGMKKIKQLDMELAGGCNYALNMKWNQLVFMVGVNPL